MVEVIGSGQLVALDRHQIANDLAELGLSAGHDVLVHCSMRRIGRLADGPATLLAAIRDVIGPHATVVVPTQTANNSTTSSAFREATRDMDAEQLAAYEARMEGFDRDDSPSYRMGALAEHVRCQSDAIRSAHPQTSFAALGPMAAALMAVHDLVCHLGKRSPLGALYAAGARILLLGAGYDACTAFHLAEYDVPGRAQVRPYRCYIRRNGQREPRSFEAAHLDDGDFGELGAAIDRTQIVRAGQVGAARTRLLPLRDAVDFAAHWMANDCRPSHQVQEPADL